MILILTDPSTDIHASVVSKELQKRGLEHYIYDPSQFPYASTFTVSGQNSEYVELINDDKLIRFSDISSIWFRKPAQFEPSSLLHPSESDWLKLERSHFLSGLWRCVNSLWVSEPHAINLASHKLYQLSVSASLGFSIPRYIATNDVDHAREFVRSFPNGVIVKAFAQPYVWYGDGVVTLYTHVLNDKDMSFLEHVQYGPVFLQEFVPKIADIRVTIVGDRLFATRIDCGDNVEAQVDFRTAHVMDLNHTIITLPNYLVNKCLALVKFFGLNFGALDLILTREGEFIFLEINPNGQWLWLEWLTGQPLTESVCNLLGSGKA